MAYATLGHRTGRLLVAVVSVGALWLSGTNVAWSNGESFFLHTMEVAGDASYVLYGSVKDRDGHYIQNATVTVTAAEHVLKVSAQTDELGRFRAPDIGRAINDLGYEVDPSMITVSIDYPGYHIARRDYRGKNGQNKGVVEVDFQLDRNGAK